MNDGPVVGPADAKARRLATLRDAQNAALAAGRWKPIYTYDKREPVDYVWLPAASPLSPPSHALLRRGRLPRLPGEGELVEPL